jgi:ABC-type oligopeptide transport system substrate-binding subunit
MEMVEGDNLHERPPAGLGNVVAVARQICAALEHAHSHGIVHRDLKPENVVIDREGQVRLMDFGIARSVSSRMTQEGTILGTVFYMAPEQALGHAVDARADLYSLGVMLYELTTGALPFTHEDPGMVISQHVHATPVPPRAKREDFPPELSKLILALLSKDPKERPAAAAEVGRMLASPSLLSLEAAPEDEPTALERIAHARMVGRDKETALARALWMQARGGQSQILLISGDPGVGKSRLLRELVTHVELTGGRALGAACYEEAAVPYAVFRQMLREALRDGTLALTKLPAAVWPDFISLLPELATELPDVTPHPPSDPHADQARLFESIGVIISELIRNRPLLVYVDDAHWADSGTLSLLRHLVRATQSQAFMAVLTYRGQELGQALPFHESLLDIERAARAATIGLRPLRREETRELLAAIFLEQITEEFLDGIHSETEGNPFFIEEVCKALVEGGKLYFHDGRWHRPAIEELGIPRSVRVALQSRINRLSDESQQVLKQAAVLGREIELGALSLALDADEETVLSALEDAERAQLVERTRRAPRTNWVFAHPLIPRTLMEGLRIVEHRQLHRKAASALAKKHPEAFGRLASHFLQAGELEQGIEHLMQAGNAARLLHAHQEAISCYLQAVDYYLQEGNYRRASSVQFRLALTYHNAFEFDNARKSYDKAFALLQQASVGAKAASSPPALHPLRLACPRPSTLDSTRSFDTASDLVIQQLFSGLVEERPDVGLVPDIAESWEVSNGGTKYVFRLRPDARWTDGQPVGSDDFICAWKRILDPQGGSRSVSLFYDIRGAKSYHEGELADEGRLGLHAPDPQTLVVELETPINYFLSILATPQASPVPRHVVDQFGDAWVRADHLVTNGPYRLREWVEDESMYLERWEGYPGTFTGNAERLDVRLHSAAGSGLTAAYHEDQLDILTLTDLSIEEHEIARHRHAGEYVSIPVLSSWVVFFDQSRQPFDDPRIRRAFLLATDQEAIADVSVHGLLFPAAGSVVPPGIPGYSRDQASRPDTTTARRLLADSGYPDGHGLPGISFLAPTYQMGVTVARALSAQWKETLAVNVSVQQMEFQAWVGGIQSDQHEITLVPMWASFPDPFSFLDLSETLWLGNTWRESRYEALVQEGRRATDLDKRLECYRDAQRILADQAPFFPILHGRMHFLLKPWVSRFPTSPMRYWFFKDVVIDPH